MRILLTGNRGYIGRHLEPLLRLAGHEVYGFDSADSKHCDVMNDVEMAMCYEHIRPNVVIHLAAVCLPAVSVLEPVRIWQVNLGGTSNVLDAIRICQKMRLVSTPRFIFASTLLARHPESSPYAASKRAAEQLIESSARAHGFSAITLRLANVAGNLDTTPGRLIPSAIGSARGKSRLPVYGGHSTPDGTCIRDYVHVDDVANAFLCAINAPCGPREVLNVDIGTGQPNGVYGVLRAVERVSGEFVQVEERSARLGDVTDCVADARIALKTLGWKAERGLEEIVKSAWEASHQ